MVAFVPWMGKKRYPPLPNLNVRDPTEYASMSSTDPGRKLMTAKILDTRFNLFSSIIQAGYNSPAGIGSNLVVPGSRRCEVVQQSTTSNRLAVQKDELKYGMDHSRSS
jgi:hypothetical protein